MFPPLTPPLAVSEQSSTPPLTGSDAIQGLSNIPDDWPDLPANASMAAEISWVQANRLRIAHEQLGKTTLVHLDRALSPAPSWAALGWLETSIRSYAKFVDVASKVASTDDGEASWVRRERMALDEMERIIDEMMEDRSTREGDNVGSVT